MPRSDEPSHACDVAQTMRVGRAAQELNYYEVGVGGIMSDS